MIKACELNYDGKTNGLTAPSGRAQTELETDVYKSCNINPQDITMVEAHGTGTKLGDPIEVSALTKAFQAFTRKTNYCALGSVKSNIGHTGYAAGLSGLIKVLLSLKNKKIPATINFETLNPNISLKDSPFYINTELKDWIVPEGKPRIACVSSFGFTGTNAHIVAQEYAPRDHSFLQEKNSLTKEEYLFVLSAKTTSVLVQYAKSVISYLKDNSPQVSDFVYTFQVGREAMTERLAILCTDKNSLIFGLNTFLENKANPQIFCGSLKKNHALLIGETEEGKEFIEKLIHHKKLVKLAELWIHGSSIDWKRYYKPGTTKRLNGLPNYPFAKERCWIEAISDSNFSLLTSESKSSESKSSVSFYEHGEGIFCIQILESKSQNTLSKTMIEELIQVFAEIEKRLETKVVILRGTDSCFLRGDRNQQNEVVKLKLHEKIASFPLPIIAAMKGNAEGTGFLLGALCDLMVLSQEKRYSYTSLKQEIFPTEEESLFVERLGEIRAKDFLYSRSDYTGRQLQEKGWACSILPQNQVDCYAQELATTLTKMPQESLRQLKQHLSRQTHICVKELKWEEKQSKLETKGKVLLVKIDSNSLLADLKTTFSQTQYQAIVITSSHPQFFPTELQELLINSSIPIIAAIESDAKDNAWLMSLFCDACIYNESGVYSYQIPNEEVVELFSLRFGHYLAKEILFTRAEYTGRQLQERLKTLKVVSADQVVPTALQVAESWCHRKRSICQKINIFPVGKKENEKIVNTTTPISLNSKVIKATVYPSGIIVVKMTEQEAKNMFSQALTTGIIEVFEHIQQTPSYKVVVITGYDSYFASGGTKEGLLAIQEGKAKFTDTKVHQLALDCKIPVISAMLNRSRGQA